MKILHTADWHLGNIMHDINRTEEFRNFLTWLKGQIEERGIEALVVAGDIFDTVNPPTVARKLYLDFLAGLHRTCCRNVILVGGNHDSGSLLDASREVLAEISVHMVGTISGRTLDDLVCEMKNSSGDVIGICCMVPFVRDLELNEFYKGTSAEEGTENLLARLYADVYARASEVRAGRDIPIIATGHLYTKGISGRDTGDKPDDGVREIIGKLGSVDVDTFGSAFDYVALGHIHYSTMVGKNPRIRYSGSPFVMGFDEAGMKRVVLEVDTAAGAVPVVNSIEVPKTIRFEQFVGDLDYLKKSLVALGKELKDCPMPTFVDVVLDSDEVVNLNSELDRYEDGAPFIVKRHRLSRKLLKTQKPVMENAESLDNYQKEDYFRMLLQAKHQISPEAIEKLYAEYLPLLQEAADYAERNNEN